MIKEKVLLIAEDEMIGKLVLRSVREDVDWEWFSGCKYIVTMEEAHMWTESNWNDCEHTYRLLAPAYNMFKELLKKHEFPALKMCDGFEEDYAYCLDPDYHKYSSRDYGPSNPWDAPGMCVSDFIKGVI